jgi:hypothetical protein
MFGWISAAREKAFAVELAEGLVKELPPALMDTRRGVLSVNKVTRLLERTYRSAALYQEKHRIGGFKRAILANSFKWELKNRSYPDDFVDVATEGLVVELSRVAKNPKSSGATD